MGTREKPISVEEAILRRMIDEADALRREESEEGDSELDDIEIKKLLARASIGHRFDVN